MKKSVLVFCASSHGINDHVHREVEKLGKLIAAKGHRLIYGGGNVGLMGRAANACLDNGGDVLGIIPEFLMTAEVGHVELSELRVVESMHQRKAIMCAEADFLITLPGGFGTLDEFFEMLTWLQLGLHNKPIGLWNVKGFYDPLILQMDRMVEWGYLRPSNRALVLIEEDLETLLDSLLAHEYNGDTQWFKDRNL